MRFIPAIVISVFVASAVHAKEAPADRELLDWAHNAPQTLSAPGTKVASDRTTKPNSVDVKPLVADRVLDLPEPVANSSHPGERIGILRLAGRAVGAAGSTVGKACTGFAHAYSSDDNFKPDYMRPEDRTARYNSFYSVKTNSEDRGPYSELQTGAKSVYDVPH